MKIKTYLALQISF